MQATPNLDSHLQTTNRSLAGLVEAMGGVGGALTPLNTGEGGLNDGCGAEHVQKAKAFPAGVDAEASAAGGTRFCSLDGDADRVVFFFGEKGSKAPVLLDGDKILILLASHIGSLLSDAGLASDLRLGVIQTAYANGASTDYLLSKLSPDCHAFAATGVKHLHHKALDYDIGAYFEANGHGTVIFNDKALAAIRGKAEEGNGSAKTLEALTRLINPAIGDAISDALAVEAVLSLKGWSLQDWASMYTDLPSRMTKELVKDRTLVKTVPDETKVVEPAELQVKIDELVSKVKNGRCFVRPSGTEDCVRVYAEAHSQEAADQLAADVGKEVQRILN